MLFRSERIGYYQVSSKWEKLNKNYNLANGILDMSDYVTLPNNEYANMIGIINSDHNKDGLPITFYPLIPNIINTFTGEFAKRDTSIYAEAVDEYSKQEAFEVKFNLLKDISTFTRFDL